jgi:hypothetical protein
MMTAVRVVVAAFVLAVSTSALHAQKPPVGSWDFTAMSPEGEFKAVLVIREEDGKLKAFGQSPQGERPFDSLVVEGTRITLVMTIPYNGSPMTITYSGKIDNTTMEGDADFGGLATGKWSATAQK